VSYILVIDDEDSVRDLICFVLREMGHEVDFAADGPKGIRALAYRPADLVVCDLVMPGKNGLETIRELRTHCPSIKVIAVSGGGWCEGWLDPLEAARHLGAVATLDKPFTLTELRRAVRDALVA
jgi:CheY-like chemotaxis protein